MTVLIVEGAEGQPATAILDGGVGLVIVSVDEAHDGERVVCRVTGEVDAVTADQLVGQLLRVYSAHGAPLTVDLSAVTFMDLAGVDALLRVDARLITDGARGIRLRRASRPVALVMSFSGAFAPLGRWRGTAVGAQADALPMRLTHRPGLDGSATRVGAGAHAARMGEDEVAPVPVPRRSPYAVPCDRFAGDAQLDRPELVAEHSHDHPAASPAPALTASDDGDGPPSSNAG